MSTGGKNPLLSYNSISKTNRKNTEIFLSALMVDLVDLHTGI